MAATDAKTIRQNLKAEGITARQVSVRNHSYSMGSSVTVTIKDHTVDAAKVRRIAEAEQEIRRCEVTHEILSGGNMFVHFGYSNEAKAGLAAPYRAACDAAHAKLDRTESTLHTIEGTPLLMGLDGYDVTIYGVDSDGVGSRLRTVWDDAENIAFIVGQLQAGGA